MMAGVPGGCARAGHWSMNFFKSGAVSFFSKFTPPSLGWGAQLRRSRPRQREKFYDFALSLSLSLLLSHAHAHTLSLVSSSFSSSTSLYKHQNKHLKIMQQSRVELPPSRCFKKEGTEFHFTCIVFFKKCLSDIQAAFFGAKSFLLSFE